jgi:arginine/lysine/ornithine decarboxylase
VRISDSIGRVAAEFVYIYPPGIPIVAPGEVLTADVVALIAQYKKLHLPIRGMQDKNMETILIVRSE